jgi:hypothetical protein
MAVLRLSVSLTDEHVFMLIVLRERERERERGREGGREGGRELKVEQAMLDN